MFNVILASFTVHRNVPGVKFQTHDFNYDDQCNKFISELGTVYIYIVDAFTIKNSKDVL